MSLSVAETPRIVSYASRGSFLSPFRVLYRFGLDKFHEYTKERYDP